jgi:MarR family transcriptional regulator, multiple antibiotic resistance protein MarR
VTAKSSRHKQPRRGPVSPHYTIERYESQDNIGFMMSEARARMFEILDVRLGVMGFTAAQWPILRAVARGTPTAAELCRELDYDTGSMTRMLSRLEEKRLIRRVPSLRDRRLIELQITAAGRKLYPQLRDEVIAVLNTLLIGFKPPEIEHVYDLVARMLGNVAAAAQQCKKKPRGTGRRTSRSE